MDKANSPIVYRVDRGTGFGHFLCCLEFYATLAEQMRRPFITTVRDSLFDGTRNEENAVLARYFERFGMSDTLDQINYDHVRRAVEDGIRDNLRIAVIGRQDMAKRIYAEFPALKYAEFIERHSDCISPEGLEPYDLVYVDSVMPGIALTRALPEILSPPVLRQNLINEAESATGGPVDVAIHMRHGNGEKLGNRLMGGDEAFWKCCEALATKAKEMAPENGRIVAVSDNAETAKFIADAAGGITLGSDGLPTIAHYKFLRAEEDVGLLRRIRRRFTSKDQDRIGRYDRMFLDIAVLASANTIVAGESRFPSAAKLINPDAKLFLFEDADTSREVAYSDLGEFPT